jgi:hypothetical protein
MAAILILKWPPFCFAHISVSEAHIDFMLVSRHMYSGSRNPLRALLTLLANCVTAAIMNSKMAANKTSVVSISRSASYIEHEFDGYTCLQGHINHVTTLLFFFTE